MAELICTGIAKSFGDRAVLVDLDLTVPTGTLTAILGASGSGKTTLLRVVMGFVPADRGIVRVGSDMVVDAGQSFVPPHRRGIGYVAQEGALFPHLTVAGNVAFGLPRSERRTAARITDVLALVGLDRSYADRRPHELSGGEQRRVGLARALAPRPHIVLLDEPFSGLDPGLRTETREAVVRALGAEETTAVLVTHDQSEALSTGREVGVLRAGRLVQTASPEVLYRDPVDLDVARFVGEAVVLTGTARSGLAECALGTLRARGTTVDGPVSVLIRPEQIRFAAGIGEGVFAEVVGSSYHGADTLVRLALPGGNETTVAARTFDQHVPAAGERVPLTVEGTVRGVPAVKRQLAALVVVAASLTACGGGGNSLVVYNGQHPQLTRLLVAAFERQTGISVQLRNGDSLVVATQILSEGSASPADVILSENSPELANLEHHGRLRQLPPATLGQIPAAYSSPAGRWVGVALRVSSLAYDPARVGRSELPQSILELAQPRWRGKVAIAPTDSDFPPLVGAVIARYGADRAAAWLRGLKRNAASYQDEEAVTAAVNRGDAVAGVINAYYWYRLRLEVGTHGMHSVLHYFPNHDVGSIVNVAGAGVLATSRHTAAAERFVDFLVGKAGQRIVAESDDFEYPARAGVAANAALPPFARTPHATVPVAALGDGETAARLIRAAGLA